MAARSTPSLTEFDATHGEMDRALADPLASGVAIRHATACLARYAGSYRSAVASGGDLRRSAEQSRSRLRQRSIRIVLPALDGYFKAAAERNWMDPEDPQSAEIVTLREAACLLSTLAAWERAETTDTDANALLAGICTRMLDDARRRVDHFKTQLSPEDSPDYRAVAANLVAFEAMVHVASYLDHASTAEMLAHLRDHYVKSALLAALAVIQRAEEDPDMFVHFDVAAMLVSVEHVVVVISRTIAIVDRERETAHPHVETKSEHVVREFASGLQRLAPSYLRMLRNALSVHGSPVPEFGFSVLRVLVQITRLIRILHHLLRDDMLADTAHAVALEVATARETLLEAAAVDPDLLVRVQEALDAIGPATPPRTGPRSAAPVQRS